jgi:gamma-glutamylcyclotransferase (GGCT)/AIG2-like uncharacterized protein YtfP
MKRIAVYGSLRRTEYNYRKEMGEPIAEGYITGAKLYSLGAFPAIVKSGNDTDKVIVEVYEMEGSIFNSIERMELGAGYTREPVSVYKTDGEVIEAEAYFYPKVQDWFGPAITSGDWALRHVEAKAS